MEVFSIYEVADEGRRLSRAQTLAPNANAEVVKGPPKSCLENIIIRKGYFPKTIFNLFISLFVGYSCFTSIF